MAKDARRRMRAGMDLLQVGPANSAGMHSNQHFAGTDRRHRHLFETNIVNAAIDRGLHPLRKSAGYQKWACFSQGCHNVVLYPTLTFRLGEERELSVAEAGSELLRRFPVIPHLLRETAPVPGPDSAPPCRCPAPGGPRASTTPDAALHKRQRSAGETLRRRW